MPDRSLPHLLLFGWYSEGTGFTRVLRALVPHLRRRYRITWMGVGYRGPVRELDARVHVRPTNLHGGDMVGAYGAAREWESLGADAVLALNDLWYLEHYSRGLGPVIGRVPMVGYLPLDGDIPHPSLVADLTGFSALYTYTRHAARQLGAALEGCGRATPVGVAGHGVDLDTFAPDPDTLAAGFDPAVRMARAARLFGLPEPSWVVLNASRPDPRKRIDISIDGFARFARGRPPHVRLCLHQAIAHPQYVEPLREQAQALGILDRVLWWPPSGAPLDDAALVALYNACAVGINTSLGEGFGLVSFEHAATGVPQIVPGHPALRELWGDAALRLPVRPVRTAYSPLVMGECDSGDVADALGRLYDDELAYRGASHAARARAGAAGVSWDAAADALQEGLRGSRGG